MGHSPRFTIYWVTINGSRLTVHEHMSFLDRIRECNEHDLSQFEPFYIEQRQVGWVRHDMVERLADYPDVFEITPDTISLNPRLDCPELR